MRHSASESGRAEIALLFPFSRFAWILARTLRAIGGLSASIITRLSSPSIITQSVVDRVFHLNEVLGYFLPSLAYILTRVNVNGVEFVFRPFTDDVDKLSQSYEPMVRQLLSPVPADTIVDIGANIGIHTLWLSRKVGPSGLIIAVEPEYSNFWILGLNRQLNHLTNIVMIRTALGSNPSTGKLTVPRPTLMGQASTQSSEGTSRSYSASVSLETLDNIVSSRTISAISAIKIDVEGAEMPVLLGARKTIEKFRPRLVIEVHGEDNLCDITVVLKSMNMMIASDTMASSRPNENRHFILAVPRPSSSVLDPAPAC